MDAAVSSLPPLGVVLRAANQDNNDCRWQSYLCFVPRSGKGGAVGSFELSPFIEQHPLSLALLDSSPIGEPRFPCCPLWGKCREAAKGVSLVILSRCHSTNRTPSVSPYGLPAPPPGSQGMRQTSPAQQRRRGQARYAEYPSKCTKANSYRLPWLPPGVLQSAANLSIIMIAGGNHTLI